MNEKIVTPEFLDTYRKLAESQDDNNIKNKMLDETMELWIKYLSKKIVESPELMNFYENLAKTDIAARYIITRVKQNLAKEENEW